MTLSESKVSHHSGFNTGYDLEDELDRILETSIKKVGTFVPVSQSIATSMKPTEKSCLSDDLKTWMKYWSQKKSQLQGSQSKDQDQDPPVSSSKNPYIIASSPVQYKPGGPPLQYDSLQSQLPAADNDQPVDILLLGKGSSGKSTLLARLDDDSKMPPKVFGNSNELGTSDLCGDYQITYRELSSTFVKSWPAYISDSKIILIILEANQVESYSFAFVESLLLQAKASPSKPFLVVFNKMDFVTADQVSCSGGLFDTWNALVQHGDGLPKNVHTVGLSCYSKNDMALLRDSIKQILRLFGKLKESDNKKKKRNNEAVVFPSEKKTSLHSNLSMTTKNKPKKKKGFCC